MEIILRKNNVEVMAYYDLDNHHCVYDLIKDDKLVIFSNDLDFICDEYDKLINRQLKLERILVKKYI